MNTPVRISFVKLGLLAQVFSFCVCMCMLLLNNNFAYSFLIFDATVIHSFIHLIHSTRRPEEEVNTLAIKHFQQQRMMQK